MGSIKLGFQPHTVVIEAIQGEAAKTLLQKFARLTGMKWTDQLMRAVEEHAREQGYKAIKIRRPETLYYYRVHSHTTQAPQPPSVQASMRALYYSVARAHHYKKQAEFLVKELRGTHGH